MGLIDQIFAGLAGGAHTYEHQQDTAAKEAIAAQLHAAQMANIQSEIQNRQEQRYAQGIRQGTAPNAKGVLNALNLGAGVADASGAPGVNVASQLGNVQTQQDKPEQYAPDRYQQVSPSAYVDNTATPEAVQQRRATAADAMHTATQQRLFEQQNTLEAAREAAAERRHAQTLGAMRTKPDPVQLVTGTDPQTGLPIYGEYNKATHRIVPIEASLDPKQGSGGMGGAQAPVDDMDARFSEIEGHAKDLAAGKWKITRPMQIREGMEYGIANQSAGGHGVPLAQAGAAELMDLFGAGGGNDAKKYRALMNSTRALGDDAAKVFKGRQNEDAVKREIALAQLTDEDASNPQLLQQKLDRMRHVIALARATMPHTSGGQAPSPDGKPPLSERVQQLKAQGVSREAARAQLKSEGYQF